MLDSIQEVFLVYAIDHSQLFYVSPAYEQIWGQSCASLYQNPMSWTEALHPDDRERILTAIEQQLQGQPFRQEYRIIRPDGSIRWIYARTVLLDNAAQRDDVANLNDETKISASLERLVILAEDVTGRKESDQRLNRLNRSLRMISECNQELVRATDEATLLQNICQIIVEFGGYRAAWIGFAEHNAEKRVCPVAQAGYAKDYLESLQISWADSKLGQGAMGTAIRTGA
ncbi:MAG TPA: PAS domain-containing protein, partial [Allocoleopsis sp.]